MLDVLRFDCILQTAKDFLGRLGDRIVIQGYLLLHEQFFVLMSQQRTGNVLDRIRLFPKPCQHLVDVGVAVCLEQFVEVLQRTVLAPADLDMLPAKPDGRGLRFRLVWLRW